MKLLKRGDLPPPEYVIREIENQCNLRGHLFNIDNIEGICETEYFKEATDLLFKDFVKNTELETYWRKKINQMQFAPRKVTIGRY